MSVPMRSELLCKIELYRDIDGWEFITIGIVNRPEDASITLYNDGTAHKDGSGLSCLRAFGAIKALFHTPPLIPVKNGNS